MKLRLLAIGLLSFMAEIHGEEIKSVKIDNQLLREFKPEHVKTNALKLSKDTNFPGKIWKD